jgi:hypothetical protein
MYIGKFILANVLPNISFTFGNIGLINSGFILVLYQTPCFSTSERGEIKMRKVIAESYVSLDGFIVGSNEDMSWVNNSPDERMKKEEFIDGQDKELFNPAARSILKGISRKGCGIKK